MNTKNKIALIIIVIIGFTACKKEKQSSPNDPAPAPTPVVKTPSKKELLNQIWVLKETYENGVQKSSNGKGKYEFNQYGNFRSDYSGIMQDIGTYKFTTKDSTELSVTFNGVSSPSVWKLVKLDLKTLNTEFTSGSTKFNYNYSR